MLSGILISLLASTTFFIGALPATTNYELNSYGFGSGGGPSSTSNYSLEGISGEVSGQTANTSNYYVKPGFVETQQANVPSITLTNPANYYDKLKLIVGPDTNDPSDAKYALQISTTSNFSSGVNYVKSDLTIGPTLVLADYQTYSAWGSGTGSTIIGLTSNTTYYIRAKATQTTSDVSVLGKFLESQYGPSSSAATVGQSLSFCLYTNVNCAGGGNTIAFGALPPSTVTDSPNNIGIDFATNANLGGEVYIRSANGGLSSSGASYTINSATANLASVSEGYGAKISTVSQSSGGPLNKQTPFNGSADNVGQVAINIQSLLISSNPLAGGTSSVVLKARPSNSTPAANDYSDILTLIAAATF